MTAQLDTGAAARSNPITMLPHFPAAMLGASLLDVVQSSEEGVLVVDAARNIVLVNHRAERIFGYPAKTLLEKPLDMLLPARSPGEGRRTFERLPTPRTWARRGRVDLRGRRSDGCTLGLKASIKRVTLGNEIYLALIVEEAVPLPQLPPVPNAASASVQLRPGALTTQQASEVEKRRFSRKLYDDIGQRLSVLKLDLSWLENSLHHSGRHVPARLAEMQGLLDNVITLTKSMASTLRPPVLDDFGLLPAVEWMIESFRKRTAVRCTLEHSGMEGKLDDARASAAFRIIQEALANIERHAHAGHAWILLRQHERQLEICIRDDGIGLEPDSQAKPGCYGLIAMQERVFVLGGTIRIENVRPHGVLIDACIPLEPIDLADSNLPASLPVNDTNRNRR